MHKTFRAGRDDHYLSHLEALPDKSFLEVDRPLKCSHWVRETNSSCVLLFQQFRKGLGKGEHGALEHKQTAGTHSWDKRHLFSWTAGLFKFNLYGVNLLKKTLVPRKTWRLNGTIFSYLDFELQILGPWERKDNCPRQNGSCQRCFKSNSLIFFINMWLGLISKTYQRCLPFIVPLIHIVLSSQFLNSSSNWIKFN